MSFDRDFPYQLNDFFGRVLFWSCWSRPSSCNLCWPSTPVCASWVGSARAATLGFGHPQNPDPNWQLYCLNPASPFYTLPQKKHRFNPSIFPGDPGSLTLTQGHVNFVRWSYVNDTRCQVHWYTLYPKRNATFKNLHFFWGRVYNKYKEAQPNFFNSSLVRPL